MPGFRSHSATIADASGIVIVRNGHAQDRRPGQDAGTARPSTVTDAPPLPAFAWSRVLRHPAGFTQAPVLLASRFPSLD
jgi:hypothetical protein